MENLILLPPLKRFFKLLELDKKSILYIYLYALLAGFITLSLPFGIQAIIGMIVGCYMDSSLVLLVVVGTLGTMMSGIFLFIQISIS